MFTKKTKKNMFTVGAESHPHGTILAGIIESGSQRFCVKWCPVLLKPIQKQTDTSAINLEISQGEM